MLVLQDTYQNTDPRSPTIFMLSLIFFSFSSTMTNNMGPTKVPRAITRYNGMIPLSMSEVPLKWHWSVMMQQQTFVKKSYLTS